MKKPTPIAEIFEAINTAHLSSLISGSSEPATDLRKWLIDNRSNMSSECATFFNELGVKKKGFLQALKEWFSQYHKRQCFIEEHVGMSNIDWITAFGRRWQDRGGVFYFQSEGEKKFSDDEVRQARKVGVISVVEAKSQQELHFSLEVLVADKTKLRPVLILLDQCAIPIKKIHEGKESSVFNIVVQSPTQSEFNQLIQETRLPHYARTLLKKPV